ncbi:MAG TPA: hypothetical protein VFV08_03745, partial [Puia sp.]|nr:hypothetical protein [Puia sp.]
DSLPAKSEFQKEEKEIIHKIGTNGNLAWIGAFLEEKQQSVVRVFAEEKTDTVLHTLRKTLKDLDYNEKWIAQSAAFSQWKSGFGMKELIELLGNHQDYTIHEKFLSSNETAQLNGIDKMLVEDAYRAAAENKAMLKREILLKLASR